MKKLRNCYIASRSTSKTANGTKLRFTTFLSVTLSLFIGLVILLAIYGSDWHVAGTTTSAPYKSFSREKITANIGVHIGLSSVNITLKAPIHVNQTSHIHYNERFFWVGASEIKEGYREALKKGLPFPILTIVEYLSIDGEGLYWGGRYRLAGYFSNMFLWASVAIWLLMNILFCVVPRYGAYAMILTGLLLLLTNIVYYANLPLTPMVIPFETGTLRFSFGWCYWLVLVTGFICITVGAVIAVVDVIFPHKFSTILEVDFDTPYDRHIILQEDRHRQSKEGGGGVRASIQKTRMASPGVGDRMGEGDGGSSSSMSLAAETAQSTATRTLAQFANDNPAFEGDYPGMAATSEASSSAKVPWKRQTIGVLPSYGPDQFGHAQQRLHHDALHRTQSVRRSSGVVNIPMQSASIW